VYGVGLADVLAGEPSADEIDGLDGLPLDGSDVFIAWHLRPMACEDLAAVGIGLALPDDSHSGPFQAEVETTD
jgi:hypothetical protein